VSDAHLWAEYATTVDRSAVAARILRHHIRFVHHYVNEHAFRSWDQASRNDFFQDLCVAVLELIPRYDPARGVPFVNFVGSHTRSLRWDVEAGRRPLSVSRYAVAEMLRDFDGSTIDGQTRAAITNVLYADADRLGDPIWETVVGAPDPADGVELAAVVRHVRDVLAGETFTAIEQVLLDERLMVPPAERTLLRVIGERFGVSGEWCRKVEVRLCARLRDGTRPVAV
jgi:hypothetical protein